MKYMKSKLSLNNADGFTIVEILVIILIIGILSTILVLTYSGIQVRQRNNSRIADIKLIQSGLESYYTQGGYYPTVSDLNSQAWTTKNIKGIDPSTFQDPSAKTGNPRFSEFPTVNQYSYQPTAANGISPCDNKTVACAKYTLTATLEGNSGTFSEKSLN